MVLHQLTLAPAGAEARPWAPGDGAPCTPTAGWGHCCTCSPPPKPALLLPPGTDRELGPPVPCPTPRPQHLPQPPSPARRWVESQSPASPPPGSPPGAPAFYPDTQHLTARGHLSACQIWEPQDPVWDPGCSPSSGWHGPSWWQTPSPPPGISGRSPPCKEATGALATPLGNKENEDRRTLSPTPSDRGMSGLYFLYSWFFGIWRLADQEGLSLMGLASSQRQQTDHQWRAHISHAKQSVQSPSPEPVSPPP